MEDIRDVDYRHARRVLKFFNNENLGDYHDMYLIVLETNALKYLNLIDTTHFLSAPELGW